MMDALPTIHICRPRCWIRRRMLRCPVDERITECVVQVFLWYPAIVTCARCGESWSGGEMTPRPFARGWRKRAQARALAMWDAAPHGPFPTIEEMEDPGVVTASPTGGVL